MKNFWHSVKEWFPLVIVLLIFIAIFVGIIWVKWHVYFQRFPNAAWWTFFF